MKCQPYRSEIEQWEAGGALSDETSRHARVCPSCRALYEQQAALARLVGDLKRVEAPNDFEFRLRARLAETETARRAGLLRRGFVPGMVSIGLAAVFFLTATVTLQLRRTGDARRERAARAVESAPTTHADGLQVAQGLKSDAVDGAQALSGEEAGEAASPVEPRGLRESHRRVGALVATVSATREDGELKARRGAIASAESDFRPAPSVRSTDPAANQIALANPPVAVPLPTSAQPLKVVLSDERGGARVVQMKSVSFGAQQLVGQVKQSQRGTNAPKEGVW